MTQDELARLLKAAAPKLERIARARAMKCRLDPMDLLQDALVVTIKEARRGWFEQEPRTSREQQLIDLFVNCGIKRSVRSLVDGEVRAREYVDAEREGVSPRVWRSEHKQQRAKEPIAGAFVAAQTIGMARGAAPGVRTERIDELDLLESSTSDELLAAIGEVDSAAERLALVATYFPARVQDGDFLAAEPWLVRRPPDAVWAQYQFLLVEYESAGLADADWKRELVILMLCRGEHGERCDEQFKKLRDRFDKALERGRKKLEKIIRSQGRA